ncbi:MAG: carboxypeptidase-like regulatory domain-containing protein [Saprospiraceae bacterium]
MRYENNIRFAGLLLILFLASGAGLHATDVLERTITVRFDQTPLKEALAMIAKEGSFEWSYNANILDANRRVTLAAEGWSVRETLLFVLGDDYTFKESGEYLILKRQKKPQQKLSGYISDQKTGKRMANVTVYDRKTLRSTTTDRHGYYELPVNERSEIVVSKLEYRDTVLQVSSQTPRLVKLDMYIDSLPPPAKPTFEEELTKVAVELEDFFVRSSQKLSTLNVRDSLHRRAQLSVLPGIGTNHRMSGSVVNDYSLNIFAGYSRGNRIVEVGGLGNINRENVSGVQAAGLFNITGDSLSGVQAAGLFNNLGNTARGAQFAGIYNFTGHTLRGAQFGGIGNYAGFTSTGSLQAAGITNVALRGEPGAQLAGIVNHAHKSAFQAAGIANTADSLQGVQVAGIFNRAGLARGVQIGLINYAREIRGMQLGLINLSKRGGYVVLELSANDVFVANAAFKSGVPALYTILTAGFDPDSPNSNRFWAYGAGLGARARLTRWSGLSFDLIHRHLNEGDHTNHIQEWDQAALALDLNFGKHFSIAGGPTANLFYADPNRLGTATLRERVVSNDRLSDSQSADGWLSAWWGWTAAVRIRF